MSTRAASISRDLSLPIPLRRARKAGRDRSRFLPLSYLLQHRGDDAVAPGYLELKRFGRRLSDTRGDLSSNERPAAGQARLPGLVAEAQAGSGLAGAEALHVAQHEHRAIGLRKCIDGVFERTTELARIRL